MRTSVFVPTVLAPIWRALARLRKWRDLSISLHASFCYLSRRCWNWWTSSQLSLSYLVVAIANVGYFRFHSVGSFRFHFKVNHQIGWILIVMLRWIFKTRRFVILTNSPYNISQSLFYVLNVVGSPLKATI